MSRPGFPFDQRILPAPLAFDFTSLAIGSYAGALPGGLQYSCATVGNLLSVRADGASILTLLDATKPRVSRDWRTGLSASGLLIETNSTNLATTGRDLTGAGFSQAGSLETIVSSGTIAGPDGTLGGNDVSVLSGGYARGMQGTLTAGAQSFQCWGKTDGVGGTDYQVSDTESAGSPATRAAAGTLTAAWQLLFLGRSSQTTASRSTWRPLDGRDYSGVGGITARALRYAVDFFQAEGLSYPTSYIQTSGATQSRATPRLWYPSPLALIDRGRVSLELVFIPAWSTDDTLNNGTVLAAVGTGTGRFRLMYDQSQATKRLLAISVNGAVFARTTGQVAWVAGDTVKVWVEVGGGTLQTVVKLQVNGGAAQTLLTTSAARSVLPGASDVFDLMQQAAGAGTALSSVLLSATFYPLSRRPAWAA